MADPNMEWMTQRPLALPVVLHKMPKQAERMNINFNPNCTVKVEDHLDKFYLKLHTIEVWYEDVAHRLLPCTFDGHIAACYHSLPPNSIQTQGAFKHMFLEKFGDDKILPMLLK